MQKDTLNADRAPEERRAEETFRPASISQIEHLSLRVMSHYAAIRTILDGGLPWPRVAIVYPVQGCNLHCKHCEYSELNRGGVRYMDFKRLVPALERLREHGLEAVEFCGGGEPTLHPELLDFSMWLHQMGIHVGMLSNGSGIGQEDAIRFVEAMSHIRVSIDAASPETFATVKGCPPDLFARVTAAVEWLAAARGKMYSQCELGVKMLLTKDNQHEITAAWDLAKRVGADFVQYRPARMCPSELGPAEQSAAQHTIDVLRSTASGLPLVLGGVAKSTIAYKCILTPLNVVIDTDGSAYLCCYFSHREERHCFGNLLSEPAGLVWGSTRHRKAIDGILPAECNVFDCRFHIYNQLVRDTIVNGSGFWSFL